MSDIENVEQEVDMDSDCQHCGQVKRDCVASAQFAVIDVQMVQEAIKKLPPEYKDVLERILNDWRTHALPECNPMAHS